MKISMVHSFLFTTRAASAAALKEFFISDLQSASTNERVQYIHILFQICLFSLFMFKWTDTNKEKWHMFSLISSKKL
jgi:hypothetical protein